MAFIRDYAAEAGDPFRFRIPKGIKRWVKRAVTVPKPIRQQAAKVTWKGVGRTLRAAAPYAAAFVPGVGPWAAGFAAFSAARSGSSTSQAGPSEPVYQDRPAYGGLPPEPTYYPTSIPMAGVEVTAARRPPREYVDEPPDEDDYGEEDDMEDYDEEDYEVGDPDELMEEFARGYGLDVGDPGRRRPRRRRSQLAGAGAPPSAKAAAKRKTAAKARARAAGAAARRGGKRKSTGPAKASGPKIDFGRLAEAAASGIPLAGGVISELMAQKREGKAGGAFGAGSRRRAMNPTNVRALRRSLRRVEGFKKLVKRVERQFPAMRTARPRFCPPGRKGKR